MRPCGRAERHAGSRKWLVRIPEKNVRKSELLSKEWCDLIFGGRNRDYGAYRIRGDMGRRYRWALLAVAALVFAVVVVPFGLDLYAKYRLLSELKDIGAEIKELRQLDSREGFERKHISAGRAAPRVNTVKDAHRNMPDIVEETRQQMIFGTNGPETFTADEMPLADDRDSTHNRERTELPIEGPQLTAVEVVEEMPQFPGGHKALMDWLDEHIPYPASCRRRKVEGEMELTFIVDAQGNVVEPAVSRSLDPELDRVALGALKVMPAWQPGRANGRLSFVRVTIPLQFHLR